MSVKKIHLFPSEESYVANSGSVDADDVALVPLNLAPVAKTGSFKEALQKPLFPSRIEQNRSVRFFFTTSKNGVFFAIKIV